MEPVPHGLKMNNTLLFMTCNEFRFHAKLQQPVQCDYLLYVRTYLLTDLLRGADRVLLEKLSDF
jgi:hypothetical protein